MKWKFAFGLASDDLFFVATRRDGQTASCAAHRTKITTFLDEDEFLGHLVRAGLSDEQTTRMAQAVLLAIAKPVSPPPWIVLDVTRRQMELLHLQDEAQEVGKMMLIRAKTSIYRQRGQVRCLSFTIC